MVSYAKGYKSKYDLYLFHATYLLSIRNYCVYHHNITAVCRSYLLDLDWTQRKKKEGTFVLDSPDTSRPNTGASSRPGLASALAEAKSRSSSLSRLPARKLTAAAAPNGGCGAATSDELAAAVRQVEETVLSPLARANTQIRDGIAQLEASLDLLRTLSAAGLVENNNNDSF